MNNLQGGTMDAKYLTSATAPNQIPAQSRPEVAFVGRSNCGKSSLLNGLLNQKNLARTSRTPGRTRMINFFSLNDQLTFADLPGYGFNKAPKHESVSWQALMDGYFANRALKRVLFLLDARRTPNEEDLRFYHWLSAKYETDVVLTKTDKLKRSELKVTRARIEDLLGAKVRVRAVSSLKRQGISELRDDLTAASLA